MRPRLCLQFVCALGVLTVIPLAAQQPLDCGGLSNVQLKNVLITSAKDLPDGTAVAPVGPQPAHCVVQGEINKHKGADGIDYGDSFELRLPTAWNGRFLFQGGGGMDGVLNPALGPVGARGSANKTALARGYAVVSTDGGHRGKMPMDSSFGADPDARADYQYRSTDLVAGVAKKLVARYYGRAADHSYMMGCSNGGREAMIAAQRYPGDFDGIVAGDPAFDLTQAAIAEAWFTEKFAEIAPKGSDGKPVLAQAFSDDDLKLLSNAVLKACDALDGLTDGMIDNPAGCHFDPAVLQCQGDKKDSCLTEAQVRAFQVTFAGPKNTAGQPLYSTWPYDAGLAAPGWRAWVLGNSQMPAINVLIYPQFVNDIALLPGEPHIKDAFSFDFDKDAPRIDKSMGFINATAADISPFRQRGGKLILYTGMSDPVFSANDLIEYYKRVVSRNGGMEKTKESARLFLIPGMNHCGGGPALDNFDALSKIQDWVEKGQAPDSIPATGNAFPGRSRPLCAYPKIAHYKGSGSTDDAQNFTCVLPAK